MKKLWKSNWEDTKRRFIDWWNGCGFIVGSWEPVPISSSHEDVEQPEGACSIEHQWMNLDWRARKARFEMAHADFPLETLPVVDPWFGPGSMALYLGAEAGFDEETIWYKPYIYDRENTGLLRFDPKSEWWTIQVKFFQIMKSMAQGNYYVGCPDLVENWDILASLRGSQYLLMDMIDDPGWVKDKIHEINEAWFQANELLNKSIIEQDGISMFGRFRLWAPSKVAKVQCDGASMFSPQMFREFVVPALTAQCEWLDYSLFHLDGSQCLCHLDTLLGIEALTAIEWTPDPKSPDGGSPAWYEMYRRILAAGKRVQVLDAGPEEIEPLLDAVGGNGIYFLSFIESEAEAESYKRVVDRLR